MADVQMSMEEYQALLANIFAQTGALHRAAEEADTGILRMIPNPPKKRKVSKYNREFGRQLKALKRKHPKTKSSSLMKRAHTATKKALKS